MSKGFAKRYVAAVAVIGVLVVALAGAIYFFQGDLPAYNPNAPPSSTPTFAPSLSPSVSVNPTIQPTMPVPLVETARNWAGYVVASDLQNPQPTVTGVNATWTVPAVTDIGTDAFSAVWVGIGGQYENTLIQVGIEQDFVGGQAQYSAWYEMLPADSVTIGSLDVSAGDQIEASITLTASNRWLISISDKTTGQKYQKTFTYKSGQLSAEWIVERPEINNILSTLADFGNVTFTECKATLSGTTGAISDFPSSQVIMDAQQRRGQLVQLIDISTLSQGTDFTVSYLRS